MTYDLHLTNGQSMTITRGSLDAAGLPIADGGLLNLKLSGAATLVVENLAIALRIIVAEDAMVFPTLIARHGGCITVNSGELPESRFWGMTLSPRSGGEINLLSSPLHLAEGDEAAAEGRLSSFVVDFGGDRAGAPGVLNHSPAEAQALAGLGRFAVAANEFHLRRMRPGDRFNVIGAGDLVPAAGRKALRDEGAARREMRLQDETGSVTLWLSLSAREEEHFAAHPEEWIAGGALTCAAPAAPVMPAPLAKAGAALRPGLLSLLGAAACASVMLGAAPADAGLRHTGFFTNDYIGDGKDRWRSGSYTAYWVLQNGAAVESGRDYDFRLRAEVVTPWEKKRQKQAGDRPYAAMLGFGLYGHDRFGMTDVSLGGEIVAFGDQTGLPGFQKGAHEHFWKRAYNVDKRSENEIGNRFSGMITAEVAQNITFGDKVVFRPYGAVQAGYETFAQLGVDVAIGNYTIADRYVRDPVTGFIKPHGGNEFYALESVSLVVGADYTHVWHSDLISGGSSAELEPDRLRARAGVSASFGPVTAFYGATYMGKEFKSQTDEQVLGTLSLEIRF